MNKTKQKQMVEKIRLYEFEGEYTVVIEDELFHKLKNHFNDLDISFNVMDEKFDMMWGVMLYEGKQFPWLDFEKECIKDLNKDPAALHFNWRRSLIRSDVDLTKLKRLLRLLTNMAIAIESPDIVSEKSNIKLIDVGG